MYCRKRHSCFGINPVFMSPPTSSIRYGTCAVHHHTLPSHAVSVCSAKRSPFSGAPLPPVDPFELVGFATDSPVGPPPPLPLMPPGSPPGWVIMTPGRRRTSTSTDNSSSTFGGVGRSCRTTVGGCTSSTLSGCSRWTTGTGPAAVDSRCPSTSQPAGCAAGGGAFSRTDSAPLPLSDYDEDDSSAPVHQRLLQPPSVLCPTVPVGLPAAETFQPPSVLSPAVPVGLPAPATTPAARRELETVAAENCRPLRNCPHSLATSVAICRL